MFYVLIDDDDDDDVDVSRASPISRTWLFRIMYPIIWSLRLNLKKIVEDNNRLL